jgi:hypothetical protein
MSNNHQKSVEGLYLFLASADGESRDEVTRGLRAAGVNVDAFVADLKRIAGARGGFSRVSRFANKTREEILKLLEDCQVGISDGLFQTGLATREGGELNQLSDEQLRLLLEKLEAQSQSDPKD